MNKIRVLASAIVCFMSFLIVTIPVKATGTTYSGSNVEAQNYSTWSSTVESYLVPTDKGLMRVQAANSIDGYLVEYYDANYNVTSSKIIAEELPIWGGFYQSETYGYFIVTGQTNWDESADVEVVRITRYDENWKRIGSTGLYNCNTTIPFDAGSLRMAEYDKYLFIRTSHEMYQSSDGYNHQANMTIRVNMSAMSIVDSYSSVMNITYGYASHSFNQFVKVDDGKLVAVDHGDAYPRSVALFQYPNKVTDSNFSIYGNGRCKTTHVLPFSTAYGLVNPTGASVGSFEVSSTNYLVAGNSVVQDDNALSKSTRNIYVAAVSKETNEVTINWITSDAEGSITNSTPHMVPIANDKYLLMWSKTKSQYSAKRDVYYTTINGKGQRTGEIYHFEGNLSDCVPIVQGSKLIWYTWQNDEVKFYEINTKDMSAQVIYKDGLVLEDGVWKYYEDNRWNEEKRGLVKYKGEEFIVIDGYLRADFNGLCLTPVGEEEKWYFYSAGQVQKSKTGFAEYNGAWFYLNKGELDATKTGIYEYDGGYFLLAEGRLIKEYKGLYENTEGPNADGKWYYFGDGKLQDQYTGLALYDGVWFYLKNGCLAEDFTGTVTYDGAKFTVVNGMVTGNAAADSETEDTTYEDSSDKDDSEEVDKKEEIVQHVISEEEVQKHLSDIADAEVGDTVIYGAYEQDGNISNGSEEIQWIVLDKKDGKALLLSVYALENCEYSKTMNANKWVDSYLREYLNRDFYNLAFSEYEQGYVPIVELVNDDSFSGEFDGGDNTLDRVFVLSYEELVSYFTDLTYVSEQEYFYGYSLFVEPSEYILNAVVSKEMTQEMYDSRVAAGYNYPESCVGKKSCYWWLRTPGDWFDGDVMVVEANGQLMFAGVSPTQDVVGVRPAVWIDY